MDTATFFSARETSTSEGFSSHGGRLPVLDLKLVNPAQHLDAPQSQQKQKQPPLGPQASQDGWPASPAKQQPIRLGELTAQMQAIVADTEELKA